jgi:hypothetical protein
MAADTVVTDGPAARRTPAASGGIGDRQIGFGFGFGAARGMCSGRRTRSPGLPVVGGAPGTAVARGCVAETGRNPIV